MKSKNACLVVRFVGASIIIFLAGCTTKTPSGKSGDTIQLSELHSTCPDMTGSWHSDNYEALLVTDTGEHRSLTGLSMTLQIDNQLGCHFSGANIWSNEDLGGTEYLGGVINPDGNWVTMLEVGEHPAGGTTGRIDGQLIDGNRLNWEYVAYSSDGSRIIVFSTVLGRDTAPGINEVCPDISGEWRSSASDALIVNGDGSTIKMTGIETKLEITDQSGCHFRGINTWINAHKGDSRPVAGILHANGKQITMLEVGKHSDEGTLAYIRAGLDNNEIMEWDYIGLSRDRTRGQSYASILSRQNTTGIHQECPDLTGTWSSNDWEGFQVDNKGDHEIINFKFQDMVIEEQLGCTFKAAIVYGASSEESGHMQVQAVGAMNAESGVMTLRLVDPDPVYGKSAIITNRALDPDTFVSDFTGISSDGSEVLVYLLSLSRE